jgi:starch-binding outer membrane protein, SusD/RagB family
MKTKYTKFLLLPIAFIITLSGCESMVDGINDNPNQFTLESVDAGLFLNGAELSNMDVQLGYLVLMAGYYSGQLVGIEQTELNRYNYSVTSSTFNWDGYQGVITPVREIQKRKPDNRLYQGITKVLEANLIGTYASLFGDIPYSEAVTEIEDPAFDNQNEIFNTLQSVLSEAINYLENAGAEDVVLEDYIFDGNATKWIETAYTLKARFYMYTKEYSLAYSAAQNGISSDDNSMVFVPMNAEGESSTNNKLNRTLANARLFGIDDSYLKELLDNASTSSRNNSKTNEEARLAYYTIDYTDVTQNTGIAAESEPQPIVSYQENLLILAEAGARTQSFNVGLNHLNELRQELGNGVFFNSSVDGLTMQYDDYVAADFNNGGIENADGLTPERALLREIIEERYISGFTSFMPFDDARRLNREADSDIAVPFPLNTAGAVQNIERFLYPQDEVESNVNTPEDPGLYAVTRVNAL